MPIIKNDYIIVKIRWNKFKNWRVDELNQISQPNNTKEKASLDEWNLLRQNILTIRIKPTRQVEGQMK